jgi:putative membrane protein
MPISFSRRVSLLPKSYLKDTRHNRRQTTYPLANSSRKKDRRWPLVLRFWKGSIHGTILFPLFVHSLLAAFVVWINQHINSDFNLPSSIIPSLSIVVGLMLVFRNQTAYSRFWNGRMHLNTVTTAVRCLSRQILVLTPAPSLPGLYSIVSSDSLIPKNVRASYEATFPDKFRTSRETSDLSTTSTGPTLSKAEEARTMETVKILIAMLYTIKNHLRAEWGVALSPGTSLTEDGQEATAWE